MGSGGVLLIVPSSESGRLLLPPPGEDPEEGEDLRAYLNILRRRLPLIVGITTACTLVALIRTLQLPSVYSATVRVKLANKEAPDPLRTKYAMYWEGVSQEYLNTQTSILESMSLASEVVKANPKIAAQLEIDTGMSDPTALAGFFQTGVKVQPVRNTYLVDVSYLSYHPERCAPFANAIGKAYIAQLASLYKGKTQVTEEKLLQETDELRKKWEASRKALVAFLHKNRTPLFESHKDMQWRRIGRNSAALDEVLRKRIKLTAEMEAIARHKGSKWTAGPIAASLVVQRLRAQLAVASLDLTELRARYGDNWHKVKAAKAKVDELKEAIQTEAKSIKERLESDLHTVVAEEKELQKEKSRLKTESARLDTQIRLYETLKADVEANKKLYDEFSTRLKEVTHFGRTNTPQARIIDPAYGLGVRVQPRHTRNVAIGFLLGGILGVLAAFVLERLSDRLRTLPEAIAALQLPSLGVIPNVTEVKGEELDTFALANSRSIYAEAFRRARIQLSAVGALPAEGCGVLMTSSGVPREGKSVCAINLAIACAQVGKRTLLIDGDMRSPRVHSVFKFALTPGLGEYLASGRLEDDMIHSTWVENLSVLTAGSHERNPAELLASQDNLGELIAQLREQYDRIIIDTPPIAAVSDATLMAPVADAVVLIVSAEASSQAASTQAATELTRVGKEPVGLIFNHQSQHDLGYYYYSYYGRYTDPNRMPPT